jgi:glycerol-3-phosphate dehydrogenase
MVLVVDRPLVKDFAVGLPDRSAFHDPDVLVGRSERFFFITPWKGRALVGSAHLPFEGPADDCRVSEEEISAFLDAVNAACPPWALRRADVSFVYRGLLPTAGFDPASGCVQVEKKQKILDHGSAGGPDGLVSVLGVKYTTARDAAVRTVELAGRKLGIPSPVDAGTFTPVGGAAGRTPPGDLKLSADGAGRKVGKEILRHLHDTYGPAWGEVLRLIDEDPRLGEPIDPAAEEVAAEIAYGVREEMASKLSDLVLRRTGLGNMGHPGRTALERCADLAARELGWDEKRRSAEIEEVESIYRST